MMIPKQYKEDDTLAQNRPESRVEKSVLLIYYMISKR